MTFVDGFTIALDLYVIKDWQIQQEREGKRRGGEEKRDGRRGTNLKPAFTKAWAF